MCMDSGNALGRADLPAEVQKTVFALGAEGARALDSEWTSCD